MIEKTIKRTVDLGGRVIFVPELSTLLSVLKGIKKKQIFPLSIRIEFKGNLTVRLDSIDELTSEIHNKSLKDVEGIYISGDWEGMRVSFSGSKWSCNFNIESNDESEALELEAKALLIFKEKSWNPLIGTRVITLFFLLFGTIVLVIFPIFLNSLTKRFVIASVIVFLVVELLLMWLDLSRYYPSTVYKLNDKYSTRVLKLDLIKLAKWIFSIVLIGLVLGVVANLIYTRIFS